MPNWTIGSNKQFVSFCTQKLNAKGRHAVQHKHATGYPIQSLAAVEALVNIVWHVISVGSVFARRYEIVLSRPSAILPILSFRPEVSSVMPEPLLKLLIRLRSLLQHSCDLSHADEVHVGIFVV